jgi:hypothetical protein
MYFLAEHLHTHFKCPIHTEYTAYTVGHHCKPYIQPNQPWRYPSNTRIIRVYLRESCMILKIKKKQKKNWHGCDVRV